jgi:hypothetical protein
MAQSEHDFEGTKKVLSPTTLKTYDIKILVVEYRQSKGA